MPKGFTDQEKAAIRARLLAAGEKQFSAHGLKKTSVEELAAAVKISKGAFYLFYDSKESLFIDVAEQVAARYRHDMLAALERPGATPRARLFAAFKVGFNLLKTEPILQYSTSGDYDQLLRRVPPEIMQAHMAQDHIFLETLIARAEELGLHIQVKPEQISGLLYPLVLGSLRVDELGPGGFEGNLDVLLELVAAYCLGEMPPP